MVPNDDQSNVASSGSLSRFLLQTRHQTTDETDKNTQFSSAQSYRRKPNTESAGKQVTNDSHIIYAVPVMPTWQLTAYIDERDIHDKEKRWFELRCPFFLKLVSAHLKAR
jgi:hypothetical protein